MNKLYKYTKFLILTMEGPSKYARACAAAKKDNHKFMK